MRTCVLLLTCSVFAQNDGKYYPLQGISNEVARIKRNAVGALHIITNHAQPIHADVKSENFGDIAEKPCPHGSVPSHIEPGVVFQVTAPEDTVYQMRSLRKSLPDHLGPSTLDLVRNVNRLVTLTVLIVSAIFEFYPMLRQLVEIIRLFLS